ncbi:AI-2E family transporter [Cryobacterium sp. PAMC25264]|uniref:AI-2E family transporter n=1 Tax=Cryobacterium sp. PAMC25264 TaxID=2861288 RepID=UPI001C6387F9|nr:AI-2E family transporter [Cryobacterium sp. PAMC25264]QYF74258.1 AI-2E family transporter [Cryobacterium sp. PAMC25264]
MRIPDNSGARSSGAGSDGPTTLRTLLTDKLGWLGLRSAQILLLLALVAVVIVVLVQVKLVVIPVLIAIILASALSPVIKWLRRRGLSPILATWVTLLGAIVVFGSIVTLIVFAVENQWSDLASSASDGIDQLSTYLTEGPLAIDAAQLEDFRNQGVDFLTSSQFGSGALAGASAVGEFFTGLVLVIVILFFFLKDGDVIWAFFLKPFRGERLQRGRRIGTTTVRVLGGYIRGTAIVAFVDAAAIGIGLAILGVPLALPLAVIVFLTAFIPLIGATIAGILAALVALVANGWVVALIVVGIVVLVNQLEGNFLQPVVMAQSLKLHPLVILVALTAGTILAGIIGAVLAVPIAAVGWAIAKTWNAPPELKARPQLT